MRELGEKKQEPEETLLDSLNPLLRLSVSAVCIEGLLLWICHKGTRLCLTELLLLLITANKVHRHKLPRSHGCVQML